MSFDQDGDPTSPQILIALVLSAVFAGVLFALWLFRVMAGT